MVMVDWNIDYNESEEIHVNDICFRVKYQISFEDKIEFASEYLSSTLITDDNGFAFSSYYDEPVMFYLILKYYTDIDLDNGFSVGSIYDYAIKYSMIDSIKAMCGKDLQATERMCNKMINTAIDSWKHDHSIGSLLSKATDEKLLKEISESKVMTDEMIKMINGRKKATEENNTPEFAEFAKHNK